jgi:hypothetical protein
MDRSEVARLESDTDVAVRTDHLEARAYTNPAA